MIIRSSLILAAITLLVSIPGQAAETNSGSEFFHQANPQTSELKPEIAFETLALSSSSFSETISGWRKLGVSYEYGLNQMLAFGADLSFRSQSDTQGGGVTGFNDFLLYVKATQAFGLTHLRYGLAIGVPLQNDKVDSYGTFSAGSGAVSLAPYIGVDTKMGDGILGARVNYSYYFYHSVTVEDGSSLHVDNGSFENRSTVMGAVFYELFAGQNLFGADLHYAAASRLKFSPDQPDRESPGFNPLGLDLYARLPVTFLGDAAILPNLKWDFSNGDFNASDLVITVAARWAF